MGDLLIYDTVVFKTFTFRKTEEIVKTEGPPFSLPSSSDFGTSCSISSCTSNTRVAVTWTDEWCNAEQRRFSETRPSEKVPLWRCFRRLQMSKNQVTNLNINQFIYLTFPLFWGLAGRLLVALISTLRRCPRFLMGLWVQSSTAGSTNFPRSSSSVTNRSILSAKCLLMHHTIPMRTITMAIVINPSQKGSSSIRCESGLYGIWSQRCSHREPASLKIHFIRHFATNFCI